MRVIVLGGGVIGVTTAWYLAGAGHEVTVLERQPGVGLETSFANAGEVSPGYSTPWAAPGMPFKALKWLFTVDAPLALRLAAVDRPMIGWIARLLRNCTADRYAVNKERMLRLAGYSRDCLAALRAETGLAYDQRTQGTLQLFRSQSQVDAAQRDIAVLQQAGVAYELLDPAGCIAVEPALARAAAPFAGGLRLPGDETGDCHLFTRRLAELAAARGVEFRFGVDIRRLLSEGGRIIAVDTAQGQWTGDLFIAALGSHTPQLLRPLGVNLPVYPVKGYSLTIPVTDAAGAPESTVLDESLKVATTRLGDRIRVGGMAELGGFDLSLPQARRRPLLRSVGDFFPHGGDVAQAQFWCGLRPMTPDGPPVLGPTRYANLHLNTGHGTLGWTMACGSGRALADLVSGRKTAIPLDGLTIARYG